jgi:uncharacterized protein with PIN domain
MPEQSKRAEEWEKFEEWVQQELEKARRRFMLAASFDEMEEIAGEVGQAIQQEMMAAAAEQREPRGIPRCPECGEQMQRKGKKTRRMKTSKGGVRFKRERWACPACGASLFPPGSTPGADALPTDDPAD